MAAVLYWTTTASLAPRPVQGKTETGDAAMAHVRELVGLGPRPSGSEAHRKMQAYIVSQLESAAVEVEQRTFTAETPNGPLEMTNIVGRVIGSSGSSAGNVTGSGGRIYVLGTHYETKLEHDFEFVGANDGGSGTGLLLALAPLLVQKGFEHEVRLVFFDGEETIVEWSEQDSLYGSRHLVEEWKKNGTIDRIAAFLLLDLIGDADLDIMKETNSTPWLQDRVWDTAKRLGHARSFSGGSLAIEDDHIPFLRAGVPSIDLIDYNYGPGNRYWHSPEDTLDKLSANSLQVVAEVVLAVLEELDGS
jgi:glutaminyl-peptide cyclotransferase